MRKLKKTNNTVKQVKRIIDGLVITEKDLPAYGIKTAEFARQFYDPKKEQEEYTEIYKYLYGRFAKIEANKI